MLVGVISDTHDRLPTFEKALARFSRVGVEAIIHAGDLIAPFAAKLITPEALTAVGMQGVTVHCIYGNNDGERSGLKQVLPQIQDGPLQYEIDGRTLAVHHFLDWFHAADLEGADVVISGHDHTSHIETRDGKVFLNPGECCGWVTGRCTAAILDTQRLDVELFDIDPRPS